MLITNYFSKILIFLITSSVSFSQSIPEKFFDALIYDKEYLFEFINKDEIIKSERLGIKYEGVKNKILLTYEIPPEIKAGIISGKYKYELKELPYADTYTRITFTVPEVNYSKQYYFDKGFVATSTYYTGGWKRKQSKYFSFKLQEEKYFNDYSIKRLDDFVDMMADTLGFTLQERDLLEKEKILYTFCTDEKEVEKITGFRSKGMALLGNDEVVTAYQTHFHEVAHILINYKLKNLGLYTLPFFMEGFAVAMGGRGGMAPRVVTDVGYFLQKTNFLTYDSILTNEQFYNNDANMTYALSGLYNTFLLNELGCEKYLALYKSVNGGLDFVKNINSSQITLPEYEKFENFMVNYNNDKIMYVDEKDKTKPVKEEANLNGIHAFAGDYIKFFIKDKYKIGFTEIITNDNYVSRKFEELYKAGGYRGLKYCVTADEKSVDIYNLFNDELIYSYSRGLSLAEITFPKLDGYYVFFIRSIIFGNDFNGYTIILDER
jgi:hypothetical protein